MAKTPSTMVSLGTIAPNFKLLNPVTNEYESLDGLKSDKATVIAFICNHCPFVKHIEAKLSEVARDYQQKGIQFIAINSNDVESYPEDSPENMVITAKENDYVFPYLFDETQAVAKAYDAACTPDFFTFDGELSLCYRVQFDDARPGSAAPVTGQDLLSALDAMLAGEPVSTAQKPSLGCNIKWRE